MKRTILAAGLALGLTIAGAVVMPTAASAHTPEVTSTCSSISANLTNYEYVPGSPAEVGTRVVTAEAPAIPGTPAVPAVYGPTLHEYAHADNGNGNSNKTRWEVEGWNAGDNGKGWVPTGATQPGALITPEVPAVPEVPAIPAVTEQYEVKPAVAEQANTITLVLDGAVVAGPITFGTSYQGTYALTGTKAHSYSVVIDAIGTAYDKTIKGSTTPCAPVLTEVPYPTLIGTDVCGPDNDTVTVDPAWIEQYGSLVAGPWIDMKYKTQDGKRVVDGSAQIKAEFRKTHIWAGTGTTSASDFRRWMMYPGTAPFVHEDIATDCPVIEEPPVEEPPVEEPPVVVPPVVEPPVVVPEVIVPEAVPAALVAPIVSDGVGGDEPTTLAQTGGSVSPIGIGAGVLALLAGTALVLTRRRVTA